MKIRKQLIEWLNEIGFDVEVGRDGDIIAEIPNTCHGDYIGATVERSNYEAMDEAYGSLVVDVHPHFNAKTLGLSDPMELKSAFHWERHPLHDKAVSLCEAVGALHNYPLFDDEHHSKLEMELVNEGIDSEALDAWNAAASKFEVDLDLVPTERHEEKIKAILRGDDGSGCPHFKTGCLGVWPNRKKAAEKCEEILKEWKAGIAENFEIPGVGTYRQEAIDAITKIKDVCAGVKFSFEAPAALQEIARIMNHPGAE